MNSYHTQTEEYHTGTFGPYTLIFTSRGPPGSSLGFSFMATLGISGIVPASGHGFVTWYTRRFYVYRGLHEQ